MAEILFAKLTEVLSLDAGQLPTENGRFIRFTNVTGSIGASPMLFETSTNNILIGTETPSATFSPALTVRRSATDGVNPLPVFVVNRQNSDLPGLIIGMTTLGSATFGMNGAGALIFGQHTTGTLTFTEFGRFAGDTGYFGIQTSVPLAPLHVGADSTFPASNPGILLSRTITNAYGNPSQDGGHAWVDATDIQRTSGTFSYASCATYTTFTAVANFGHYVGFQTRPVYAMNGTIFEVYGLNDIPRQNLGTVTNRYGIFIGEFVGSAINVANQFGFYCEALTHGNAWALYTAGTTPSFIGGSLGIGKTTVDSVYLPMLQLKRAATDGSNPLPILAINRQNSDTIALSIGVDSSSWPTFGANGNVGMRFGQHTTGGSVAFTQFASLDNTGNWSVGLVAAATFVGGTVTPKSQVHGTDTSASFAAACYSADALGAALYLTKSRHATNGSHTIVQANDVIGSVNFGGSNGTNFITAAAVRGEIDGTPGATNDMPGRLIFLTVADGSGTLAEVMRMTNAGRVGLGTGSALHATFTAKLQIKSTATDATNPVPLFVLNRQNSDTPCLVFSAGNFGTGTIGVYGGGTFLLGHHVGGDTVFTERITIDTSGNVAIGTGAISTSATDGFFYLETCAGAPSGTPATYTGRVAMIYDTTNDKFWIYRGGWKQPKTPAGAAIVTWQ